MGFHRDVVGVILETREEATCRWVATLLRAGHVLLRSAELRLGRGRFTSSEGRLIHTRRQRNTEILPTWLASFLAKTREHCSRDLKARQPRSSGQPSPPMGTCFLTTGKRSPAPVTNARFRRLFAARCVR